jgi:excisionase family DNA binding protein
MTQDEIVLGDTETQKNTAVRYHRKSPNYGILNQDVYSVADIAGAIGVHTSTILEHIKSGNLKARNFGGPTGYRLTKDNIINWLENIKGDDDG